MQKLSIAAAASVASLALLSLPSTAAACSPASHCYGIATWNVEGKKGSGFKGSDAYLDSYEDALDASEENIISNETWVVFPGEYWNESGDVIGCVYLVGCSGPSPHYFWYTHSKVYGYAGVMSSEGPGTSLFEVEDYYYAPTNGWFVKAGSFTGGINGNASVASALEAGVETTTGSAHNVASATNLDWEDLSGAWHYSNWASGSGHAEIICIAPATATWDVLYDTFGFGVNWNSRCTGESLALPDSGPSEASAVGSPGALALTSGSSPLTLDQVRTEAESIAAQAGDGSPTGGEVVEAARSAAVASATPAFSLSEAGAQREWAGGMTDAVVLHGEFTLPAADIPGPRGMSGTAVTGTTLGLVLDAHSGAVTAFDLVGESGRQPDSCGARRPRQGFVGGW